MRRFYFSTSFGSCPCHGSNSPNWVSQITGWCFGETPEVALQDALGDVRKQQPAARRFVFVSLSESTGPGGSANEWGEVFTFWGVDVAAAPLASTRPTAAKKETA